MSTAARQGDPTLPRRSRSRRARRRAGGTSSTSCASCTRSLRLATTARTWDELLETVIDGTRDALHADVSSLYLLDRDGAYLTLAATNGLDRYQIGRARVPFGEGVTGRVAASQRAARDPGRQGRPAVPVGPRHRPAPLRGLDAVGAAVVARPDRRRPQRPDRAAARLQPVGRRPARRRSRTCSRASSRRAASRSEAEARVEALKAIDEARSELIALVTHELRTPLAVVRAYTELLAEEPPLVGRKSRDLVAARDARGLAPRDARAGRAAGPPRGLDPRVGPGRAGGSRQRRADRRRGGRRRGR